MSKLLLDGVPNTDPIPEICWVPPNVAKCPECGGRLLVQVCAWEAGTGKVLDDGEGVEVECEGDPDPDDPEFEMGGGHRRWQGEWMPVRDRVERWARRHLRVQLEEAPLPGGVPPPDPLPGAGC